MTDSTVQTSVDPASARPRKAGRRPKNPDGAPGISREMIIRCTLDLARKESLSEISMVRVARELGVAPGLVHYYMGSRDKLLSCVINEVFRERMQAMAELTGDWRRDVENIIGTMLEVTNHWPGLWTYVVTRNRSRLFQDVEAGETDHGLLFFDHLGRVLKEAGFPRSQAALMFYLLMLFVTSIGAERENRQAPNMHRDFIMNYVSRFDRHAVPGAAFLAEPFSKLQNETGYKTGLKLLLDGMEPWRKPPSASAAKRAKKAA